MDDVLWPHMEVIKGANGVSVHPLDFYRPPFDLLSDMIFVAALCPTGPLRRAFPGLPFVSLGGRTPLVMWFSRVKRIRYHDEAGAARQMGAADSALYNELNVVALLRQRAFFVPDIYATSDLTIRIGHAYGMPKQFEAMRFGVSGSRLTSDVEKDGRRTWLQARLWGQGRAAGWLLSRLLPLRVWPARFPLGDEIRALIEATPRAQLAQVQGQLALGTTWLPEAVSLLPLGLYLPDLRMQLPPP